VAVISDVEALKFTEKLTEAKATIYDKAMDSEFLSGLSGGGGNHRLFDNGHSILGGWKKVSEAQPDDSFIQEVAGFASSLWKDATTPKGLPFTTLDKGSYEAWAEAINNFNIPGVNKEYIYDLCSFDALEIFGTAMGVIGVALALKTKDKEKLAEILGSMGIVAMVSANPIMGICTMATTAYAYKVKKTEFDKKSMFKGGATASISYAILAVLGLPFLIELVIAVVVTQMIKKHLFEKKDLNLLIKNHLTNMAHGTKSKFQNLLKIKKAI